MNGVRGAAIGAAILVAALVAIPSSEPPAGVSESEGRIGSIYLQFNRASSAIVAPIYRELLRGVQGKVYVGCPERADWEAFCREIGGPLDRFQPVLTGRPTSAWAKDRFIPVRVGRELRLLVPERPPATPGGKADWLVAWDLSRATGAVVRTLPLDFDGGDIWMTRELSFAGRALVEKNAPLNEAQIGAMLERELGTRVVFVEGAPHHLGMFLTPLDGRTVMVADPDWGKRLSSDGDWSHEWLPRLRALPDQLMKLGLRVVPVPFVPLSEERVYITYNNVLIDGKTVYLPEYEIPALDDAARAAWSAEGFEVRPIPARRLFPQRGVVHCLVNVLSRT